VLLTLHGGCTALQFRKLAELETMEAGAIVDVIGIVDSVQDWTMITRKDGSDTRKRSMTLRDDSGRSVEVGRTCGRGRRALELLHVCWAQGYCSWCVLGGGGVGGCGRKHLPSTACWCCGWQCKGDHVKCGMFKLLNWVQDWLAVEALVEMLRFIECSIVFVSCSAEDAQCP